MKWSRRAMFAMDQVSAEAQRRWACASRSSPFDSNPKAGRHRGTETRSPRRRPHDRRRGQDGSGRGFRGSSWMALIAEARRVFSPRLRSCWRPPVPFASPARDVRAFLAGECDLAKNLRCPVDGPRPIHTLTSTEHRGLIAGAFRGMGAPNGHASPASAAGASWVPNRFRT